MNSVSTGDVQHAIVKRVDGDSLGYLNVEGRSLPFSPDTIENYRGQSFLELGITEGSVVGFVRDDAGRIFSVIPPTKTVEVLEEEPDGLVSGGFVGSKVGDPSPKFDVPAPNDDQGELLPNASARGKIRAGRALPEKTRSFGKLIDTSPLLAGDLLLCRDFTGANWISKNIADVQTRIGYGPSDARWVHAAMYLGNGSHVVEATIDSLMAGGSVRMTHLDEYCDGTNVLRFRRSASVKEEKDGWRVCIEALSQLGKPYSVGQTLKAWYDVRIGGVVAYDPNQENILAKAIVCSTLYAGAFNRALRLCLGEVNGICAPAWFSATNDFHDISVDWLDLS